MPIKPENRCRYPSNWKEIRADILKRAENRCEFCGIENYAIRENGSKVVLTIAHLDHTPENCDYGNLRALCQKCHNRYDAKHRAETRRKEQSDDSKADFKVFELWYGVEISRGEDREDFMHKSKSRADQRKV